MTRALSILLFWLCYFAVAAMCGIKELPWTL